MKGKGKGKGKRMTGKGITNYVETLNDAEYEETFFGGKGSGKGRPRTSGKGKGGRTNPKGKDGQTMKCHGCGSEFHLKRECPRNGGKGNSNRGPATLHTHYVCDYEELYFADAEEESDEECHGPFGGWNSTDSDSELPALEEIPLEEMPEEHEVFMIEAEEEKDEQKSLGTSRS